LHNNYTANRKIAEKIGFGTLVLLFVVNYGSSQVKIDEVLEPVDTRGVGAREYFSERKIRRCVKKRIF